ncbi:MAG: hypothetical protein J7K90_09375, partial [Desulfuromusa sp.]|nr:hypothetical protein [Desulfuromusa sp.]
AKCPLMKIFVSLTNALIQSGNAHRWKNRPDRINAGALDDGRKENRKSRRQKLEVACCREKD